MGLCSSKGKQPDENKKEDQSNNNQDLGNSFQGGSFNKQPQQKSSLVQTPIFHQNTGSLHQHSSGFILQPPEKSIKEGFSKEYVLLRQCEDFMIVENIETKGKFRVYVYKKSIQDSEQFITRLLQMPLNHEQIIKLIDIYEDERNYYVVYEYQESKKLTDLLKARRFTQEEAGIIFNQMLQIVKYIHDQQYSHGAIGLDSFENIATNNDNLHIELVQTKNIYLKLPTKITQKNDVQSLGLIAYWLLVGHQFRILLSKSSKWEIKKELNEEVENKKITPQIGKLIMKMIDPIPLHRISLSQAFRMSWYGISEGEQKQEKISQQKIQCQKISSLSSLITFYIIDKFLINEKEYLTNIFNQVDNDEDGKIKFADFFQIYTQVTRNYRIKKNNNKIYEMLEDEEKKDITLIDFLIAAIDPEKLLNETIIANSYMALSNKSGYVTPKSILKKIEIDEQQLLDMFLEITDFDRLNLLEFKQLLQDSQ